MRRLGGAAAVVGFTWLLAPGCNAATSASTDGGIGMETDPPPAPPPPPPSADAAACQPSSGGAAPIAWVAPGPVHRGVCTSQQIALMASCITSPDPTLDKPCTDFENDAANSTCLDCAFTFGNTTAPRGPMHTFDGDPYPSFNLDGCVAAVQNDRTSNGCGARGWQLTDCQARHCNQCIGYDEGNAAFDACSKTTLTGGCAAFAAGYDCSRPQFEGETAPCTAATDTELARKLIALFCGTP